MTEIKQQFIQVKTKSNFETRLKAGDIKDTSIAFIEDSDQIWTKGKYYSAIPKEGHERLILTWKASGEAKWEDLANMFTGLEEVLAYGVQFDSTVADPHLTRIGNMSLHKSLPIQSQLKGCIAQDTKIMYWLNESDWRFRKVAVNQSVTLTVSDDTYTLTANIFSTLQYDKQWVKIDSVPCQIESIDTTNKVATLISNDDLVALGLSSGTKTIELGAVLNGYDGTVRVYCPAFYIKSETEGTISKVWISTVKIDDSYTYQPEILIDAYRSTVLNTVPENMGYLSTLVVNSSISVVNTNTYCRGCGNWGGRDQYLTTDPFRTDLGKPRSGIPRSTMRTYSRNSNSYMMSYEQYKNIFYWLWVIEYANFNSQEAYNAMLTDDGYHQGGMGAGITTMGNWNEYNGNNPLTPCGYGNILGNGTGLIPLTIPEFDYTGYSIWFNNMATNGNICVSSNSSNNSKLVTQVKGTDNYAFYHNPSSIWGSITYVISGLTDGQTITFAEGSSYSTATEKLVVTEDGTYTIEWQDYNTGGLKWVTFGKVQDSCNIMIYNKNQSTHVITRSALTMLMPRWRGFDNPFGDIWTNLDGILIDTPLAGASDSSILPTCYIITDPDKYTDSLSGVAEKADRIYKQARDLGWTKEWHLGSSADIVPKATGGDSTKYICDWYWVNYDDTPETLLVGGHAYYGAASGLGSFGSNHGVSDSWSLVGFRAVSGFVSFSLDK